MPDLPPPTPPGLTPYLTNRGDRGEEALGFYGRAFGGATLFRKLADDGRRLLHARVDINGAVVMLSDDFPEMRGGAAAPAPGGVTLHLQVDDADAWARRAIEAGAELTMPVADMFWGDRYGQVRDPFGHNWSLGSARR